MGRLYMKIEPVQCKATLSDSFRELSSKIEKENGGDRCVDLSSYVEMYERKSSTKRRRKKCSQNPSKINQ